MKIGHLDNKAALAPVAADRKPVTAASSGVEESAKVVLSPSVTVEPAEGDGSFDRAKVERIAQAIREGRFTVDAEAIADKLISNAQELLGRPAR